jgi:hypothetical protein
VDRFTGKKEKGRRELNRISTTARNIYSMPDLTLWGIRKTPMCPFSGSAYETSKRIPGIIIFNLSTAYKQTERFIQPYETPG